MRSAALLLFLLLPCRAAAQPDLGKQEAWGDKEKQEFLKWLRSGGGAPAAATTAPSGQTREVKELKGARAGSPRPSWSHKPRFASLALVSDTLMPIGANASVRREGAGLGPKLLLGGHTFTWLRYYAGASFWRFRQQTLAGDRPLVTHVQFPAGLEVALVPLGTPHTQYLLLRGGAALHYFDAPRRTASDFATPVLGWQPTWNAGLGYEVQIPDTRWRVNALLEGYKNMVRRGPTARFYGLGFTLGTVYTF